MTMSLNPVAGFNSTLQAKLWNTSRPYAGGSTLKTDYVTASPGVYFGSRKVIRHKRLGLHLSASNNNQVAAETTDKDSGKAEKALDNDKQLVANKPQSLKSKIAENIELKSSAKDELGTQTTGASNGLGGTPSDVTTDTSSSSNKPAKRSSLTAREKLRAARVLSRYNSDSKPRKNQLGSKVLDALRESDGGKKRSGLPEAPTNMLDDSRRGMPKQGLTWDLPGGNELFFIIFSATTIGTLMFATTFLVWKVGAIHFND